MKSLFRFVHDWATNHEPVLATGLAGAATVALGWVGMHPNPDQQHILVGIMGGIIALALGGRQFVTSNATLAGLPAGGSGNLAADAGVAGAAAVIPVAADAASAAVTAIGDAAGALLDNPVTQAIPGVAQVTGAAADIVDAATQAATDAVSEVGAEGGNAVSQIGDAITGAVGGIVKKVKGK